MIGLTGTASRVFVTAGTFILIASCSHLPPLSKVDKESQTPPQQTAQATKARVQESYGKLPLYFIKNEGQVDPKIEFYEKGSGHATYFTEDGVYVSLVGASRETPSPGSPQSYPSPLAGEGEGGGKVKNHQSALVKLMPLGANKNPKIVAEGMQEGTVNYFIGNDPTKWKTNVPTYQAVVYREIYPGIDMKFYGNNRQLEYDIVVKPGADPSKVTLAYEGVDGLRVTPDGDLEIGVGSGTIVQRRPYLYQDIEGRRVQIEGRFTRLESPAHADSARLAYAFDVGLYDKKYPLNIDPTLVYSTYLGGSGDEGGDAFGPEFPAALDAAIEVDAFGHAYVTGATTSVNIGLTSGQWGTRGGHDAFVAKLNRSGTGLLYATYLGGSGYDGGHAIAIDPSGNVYLTGETTSQDFPTTPGAHDPKCGTDGLCNGGRYDAFVVKLRPNGTTLVYSTYLGGSGYDNGHDIAVNAAGHAYISGTTTPEPPSSPDFPTTVGALAATYKGGWSDAFVAQFSPDGASLVYSTYLGGGGRDLGDGIVLDVGGNVYVTGSTTSNGLATPSAYDATCGTDILACVEDGPESGPLDGYVAKLNAQGDTLLHWTYLGGSNVDQSIGIDLVGGWRVYVTGRTWSADFPTTEGALDTSYNGGVDQFVVALNTFAWGEESLVYSTFLGGEGAEDGHNLAVDASSGSVYVNGGTTSAKFPTTGDAVDSTCGTTVSDEICAVKDGYLVKLQTSNTIPNVPCTISGRDYNDCADLLYSTYLGGSGEDIGHGVAVDGWGNVYATGRTSSPDFNLTPDASSPSFNGGGSDAFVAKIGRTPDQTKDEVAALPIVDLHFHPHPNWDVPAFVDVLKEVGVKKACGGGGFTFDMDDSGVLNVKTAIDAMDSGRYLPYAGMDILRQVTFDDQLDLGDGNAGHLSQHILEYLPRLETKLREGRFAGIGELFPYNRHSRSSHPDEPASFPFNYASVFPADSPLMQRLWALSAAFQVPLSVHMEATRESVAQMERLLEMEFDGRKGIWVWAHAGTFDSPKEFVEVEVSQWFRQPPAPSADLSPDWFARLLELHNNLYVELSYRDFRQGAPFSVVDSAGMLDPDWKALLEQHSDRFVIGTDVDVADPKQYAMLITFWRGILAQLTPEAAANIAYLNADGLSNPEGPALCAPRAPSDPLVNPVAFDSITTPGVTTVTTFDSAPPLPAGFQLGDPPTYYDISTTATYTGLVTVCLNYDPAQYGDPTALRLLHYEGTAWTDVTTSNDTTTNMICGRVSSLSPFAVAEPLADTTPPVLTVPGTITTNATSPAGAMVTYSASATDNLDPTPVVTCTPSSGSTFPIGTTTVTCTATDTAGNSSSAGFTITVLTDIDGDGVADVNDSCPADLTNTCDPTGSTAALVDAGTGGTLTTPDGRVSMTIPPGALAQDTTLSITHTGSMFELATDLGQTLGIFGVEILPAGTTFAIPITLVFTWPDADSDGVVDGTTLHEQNLRITKDSVTITGRCQDEPECDPTANTFRVTVSSLSVFVLGGPVNRPPVASAGVDQHLECAGAACPIILDGSGSTDPDSSAGTQDDIAEYRWYEDYGTPQQLLLGTGQVLVVILDLGVHVVTLEGTDQSGAVGTETVAITLDPATLSLFVLEKAEVDWPKTTGGLADVKLHGRLALPVGILLPEVAPRARVGVDLAGQLGLFTQTVTFEVKGGEGEKWEYKANPPGAGIQRFFIHWKGARFNYAGAVHLKTESIALDQTALSLDRGASTDPVSFSVGGVTVFVDGAGAVTTPEPYEVDEDGEVTFTLPFELTPEMEIALTIGGQPPQIIRVGDYYTPGSGKFEFNAKVNVGTLTGASRPATLGMGVALGNEGFPGSVMVSDPEWKKLSTKEWKAELKR